MEMKNLVILCLLTTAILRSQTPVYTVYREQTATINPAMPSTNYLISEYNNSISATYHYQWIGVESAPVTQVLNWECLPIDKNILIGGQVINDKTGDIGLTGINGQFAYKMALSRMDNQFLSIGLSTGIQSNYVNLAAVAAAENKAVENTRRMIMDLSIGAYYHHGNQFYVGLSMPQLLGNRIFLNTTDKIVQPSIKKAREIHAMGGMYIDAPYFGNDGAYLEPSLWLRYLPTAHIMSLDANLRAKISSTFWVGMGYNYAQTPDNRPTHTLNIETGSILAESIGLDAGQLKIGLGFGIPIAGYLSGLGPIGEVHISYAWGGR